jgi:transposase
MGRQVYTREYKLEAIKLVRERGVSQLQACRDLGVHISTLRSWLRGHAADPEHSFPGHGQQKPEQAEIERLRREVIRLKAERDILKKAAAYFAKEST